jgi:hypothetical protein
MIVSIHQQMPLFSCQKPKSLAGRIEPDISDAAVSAAQELAAG